MRNQRLNPETETVMHCQCDASWHQKLMEAKLEVGSGCQNSHLVSQCATPQSGNRVLTSLCNSGLYWIVVARIRSLRCLQKEMVTYRHWSVSLQRDPDDVPHSRILCPLTKLNDGLFRLHSADEDAVSWLTNYGLWHTYEKKKKNVMPDLWLPSWQQNITTVWPIANCIVRWQGHIHARNWPWVVAWHWGTNTNRNTIYKVRLADCPGELTDIKSQGGIDEFLKDY